MASSGRSTRGRFSQRGRRRRRRGRQSLGRRLRRGRAGPLINVGVATTEDPQLTFSGIGAVSRDPVDQAIQVGVLRSAATVTNRVVDRGLTAPPTIRVQAGAMISVIVTKRMILEP